MSNLKDKISRAAKATVDPTGDLGLEINDNKQAPVQTSATVMPDPDGEAVKAARRRKVAGMQARGGRDSTILGGETRLGG